MSRDSCIYTCHLFSKVEPQIKDTLGENNPLIYRNLFEVPNIHLSVILVHFNLQREVNLPIKHKMPGPNVSNTQRFHCILMWSFLLPAEVPGVFDHIIVNEDLQTAYLKLKATVTQVISLVV